MSTRIISRPTQPMVSCRLEIPAEADRIQFDRVFDRTRETLLATLYEKSNLFRPDGSFFLSNLATLNTGSESISLWRTIVFFMWNSTISKCPARSCAKSAKQYHRPYNGWYKGHRLLVCLLPIIDFLLKASRPISISLTHRKHAPKNPLHYGASLHHPV
ncbi:hypothetical protein PILCRDRAFT_596581 [Piloderma croceum F 1598]|uniref:Uncharacterized protein n=1 Tax=Piloderma croceum (strain F 1598) TaxID=765440 RepID=A0A0C3AWI2_PILCF|nr:hypothetical protein PILCRDRAFT_596581 [Piloderma croceum F 1598]